MTTRLWFKSHARRDDVPVRHEYEDLVSGNSPRVNGKLVLRANALNATYAKVLTWTEYGSYVGNNGYTADSPGSPSRLSNWEAMRESAQQQAYSRIRGKLYKGSASLGVTFASMRQSRDMISNRAALIASTAEELSALASRQALTKRAANNFLEVIFGWQPLVQDIVNSCFSVIQEADSVHYVRASGIVPFDEVVDTGRPGWFRESTRNYGTVKCTMATGVRVTNPNRWLLERAGLINLAAIAWDLVPFSFLLNMVSNVGSLVNSISDFYGLSFINSSYTWTTEKIRVNSRDETYPTQGGTTQVDYLRWKQRVLMDPEPPASLILRPPDMDWSTVAVATSLAVQQMVPVIRLSKRLNLAFSNRALPTT